MIHYLDTSALVKRYVSERGSRTVREAVRRGSVAVSRIAYAELVAAVARLERERGIEAASRDRIFERLDDDFSSFHVVEIRSGLMRRIPGLVLRVPLRGYDAVHLASALAIRERGAAVDFWSADRALIDSAVAMGLKGIAVG